MVQLREKQLDLPHFRREALEIQALCRRYGVPFLINDNVDLALDIGARRGPRGPGGHGGRGWSGRSWGQAKFWACPPIPRRRPCGPRLPGRTIWGAGAVFHTGTKSNVSTLSYDTLRDICAAVKIPVVAIGGISEGNILQLKGTGIAGSRRGLRPLRPARHSSRRAAYAQAGGGS